MYGAGMNGVGPVTGPGGMMHQMDPMGGPDGQYDDGQYHGQQENQYGNNHHPPQDPPESPDKSQYQFGGDDASQSVMGGTSSLMGGAQNRLKQKRMM